MKKQQSVKKNNYKEKYQQVQLISKSQSQIQYLVKNANNQYFICKKFHLDEIQQSEKQAIIKQMNLLKQLAHPNIIKVYQSFHNQQELCYIQQYCQQGDLAHHIKQKCKKGQFFTTQIINNWILQILLALQYIHNRKIIHRDINILNIFLTSKGNIKIGSFGFSKVLKLKSFAATIGGIPNYMSPQMIQNKNYDCKTDIWSFGCLVYQLCTFKPAFPFNNLLQLGNKILKSEPDQIPSHYPKSLSTIIKKCLKKKAVDRPMAKQLLKTQYFINIIKKFIVKQGVVSEKQQKIPIKKYKIHEKLNLQNKKKIVKKKKQVITSNENKEKIQKKESSSNIKKQQIPKPVKTPIITKKNVETPKTIQSRKSKQITKVSAQKKKSNDKKQLKKIPKIQNKKIKLPQMPKNSDKKPKISKDINDKQKQIININKQQQVYKQKIVEKQIPHQQNWIQNQQIDYNLSITNKSLANQLLSFHKKNKIQYHQENLYENKKQQQNVFFESLQVRQDDENQIEQKNIKQQQQVDFNRLTLTGNQIPALLTEYKMKLQQVTKQLNNRFGADLQIIEQKTNEFDSNQFAKNKIEQQPNQLECKPQNKSEQTEDLKLQ